MDVNIFCLLMDFQIAIVSVGMNIEPKFEVGGVKYKWSFVALDALEDCLYE